MHKVGTAILWIITIFMLSSVTIFNPGQVTEFFVELFNIQPSIPELKPVEISARDREIQSIALSITEDDVRKTVQDLADMGSRVPGYPGHQKAFEYVKQQFEQIGLEDIRVEEFPTTVPVDKGASLRLVESGDSVPLFGLWPNHVQPPSLPDEGVTGKLVYGGKGEFQDLNGKPMDGSIVLMDFDCGQNYMNARMLGAKAILFYDNGRVTHGQALDKFLQVPVDVPRFWVEKDNATRLLHLANTTMPDVTVTSKMDWEEVPAWNIYGTLPGRDEYITERQERKWKDQVILLSSFYDAISVVPARAPGAENASGMAALLETAKVLKQNPPKYSVMFLANGAHFQGLAGIADFLYKHSRESDHFRDLIPDSISAQGAYVDGEFISRNSEEFQELIPGSKKIDFRLYVGLDLSSESAQVASFSHGTFNNPNWQTDNYLNNLLAPYADKFDAYMAKVFPGEEDRHVDAIAPPKRTWKNFMPIRLGFDSELVTFVGKEGITLANPETIRRFVDTPNDRVEVMHMANLTRQVQTVVGAMMKTGEDPDFFRVSKLKLQDRGHSLKGRALWFDRNIDFALPRVPVSGGLITYRQPGNPVVSCAGVRTMLIDKAEEGPIYNAAKIKGSGPEYGPLKAVKKTGTFEFNIMRNRFANRILSYEIGKDGRITSVTDMGSEGDQKFPIQQRYGWWENEMMTVLFKCRSISVFEIIDSSYLSALDFMTILNANDTTPLEYGYAYLPGQSTQEGNVTRAAVAFAKVDEFTHKAERLKVLMSTGLFGVKYLLINAPQEFLDNPVDKWDVDDAMLEKSRGTGYGPGVITHPSYQAARDMWVIDDVRMKQLAQYGIDNTRLRLLHEGAREALHEAKRHLENYDYEAFMAASRRAWGLEARGYPEVMSTANDTVRGIIFYFILLLPFSFFCERLLLGFSDITRRLGGFAGFFVLFFLILRFVHPAFKLSNSPYIIFLAFVIMSLGGVAIVIVVSKFGDEVRKMKMASAGTYDADVGRLSATTAAIALGISNLRKRPLRTGLTAMTLTLLTFTTLSFTSVQTSIQFYKLPRDNDPSYQGALVRDRSWRGMQESVLNYLHSAFEGRASIVPRSWYLSQVRGERAYVSFSRVTEASADLGPKETYIDFDVGVTTGKDSFVNALLGLTPEEPSVTGVDQYLMSGRWFEPGEEFVCLLPNDLAELVGIYPEDVGKAQIELQGQLFTVIGILDSEGFNKFKDLDDEKLTPVDTVKEKDDLADAQDQDPRVVAAAPIETFTHLESTNTLILPYEYIMDIGGTLASVAIANFKDDDGRLKENFVPDIEEFMTRVSLTMFVGYQDGVTVYSSIGSTSLAGLGNLFIPILIAALIVLNTMMGAVYERFREISIYSAVGLAPNHIAALFLAEAGVFATLGAVLGYLIGQVLVLILYEHGLLGGLELNYSSLSAISATLIVMATVFLSTLYPAKKAADMAVPDVTRKWEFPDPDGDRWLFDFPFTVGGAEVLGMYTYLTRVFESYGEGSVGDFVADHVRFTSTDFQGEPQYDIRLTTWLAPYDLGISQDVELKAIPTGEHNIYKIEVIINRLSGDVASWKRINRGFLNVLRKRFLVWRTIPGELRVQYADEGQQMLSEGAQQATA
ncbi:MAG: M28 family peptidase [bacterium]|nr:M28 family peptidase [bacterium]